ncbi:MAG: hypothetical protein AB7O28_14235 [Vicinamibacterales bacterium]
MSTAPAPQCPSADPRADGARIFGVVRREDGQAPRVEYLDRPVGASGRVLALVGSAPPAAVFRATAPCAESRCGHFDGRRCRLGARVRAHLASAADDLPTCAIRASCRWFREQGAEVCRRCAFVVTETADAATADAALRWIADPASPAGGRPVSG